MLSYDELYELYVRTATDMDACKLQWLAEHKENARLKAQVDSLLRERAVLSENDKLRKLIASLWYVTQSEYEALMAYNVDKDDGAYLRALDETIDQFRAEMSELRIYVEGDDEDD